MERTIVKPEDIKIPEGMKEALRAVDTADMDLECAKGYTVSMALAWLVNNPSPHDSVGLNGADYLRNVFEPIDVSIAVAREQLALMIDLANRYWNERNAAESKLLKIEAGE